MKMPSNENNVEVDLKKISNELVDSKDATLLPKLEEILNKCIKDKSIAHRDTILSVLLKLDKLVHSKYLKNLVHKAIEVGDVELCHAYLSNSLIPNEADAIDCLKFFIGLNPTKLSERENEKTKIEISQDLESNLNSLFSIKFDYNFLSKELKRLSSKEFIVCLLYLKNVLKRYFTVESNNSSSNSANSSGADDDMEVASNSKEPTLSQATELLNCLIDAHFTHITLSNEAQEIIADLLQMVESQVDVFADLVSIESLLKETKAKMANSNTQTPSNFNSTQSGNYFIEVLKF